MLARVAVRVQETDVWAKRPTRYIKAIDFVTTLMEDLMRHFKALAAVISAIVLAAMFTQGFPAADAADENATPKAEIPHNHTYNVSDLPVYSQDGKTFDPDVLIAYIQAAVDAKA